MLPDGRGGRKWGARGMKIRRLAIQDAFELIPEKFGDERGYFTELFRDEVFRDRVEDIGFVQENQSFSSAVGTIRGLHFQSEPFAQGKLVRCIQGAVFDVAVDIRYGSANFGRWVAVELSADKCNQIWIPPGFAHGFCTLAADCAVAYKVTAYYSPENDHAVAWNDPVIGVDWPNVASPDTLSRKDSGAPMLSNLPEYF